jgi:hypothetical protein
MTEIEAAEWVMKEDVIVTCSYCSGSRGSRIPYGGSFIECINCEGEGRIIAPEYIEACTRLNVMLGRRVMQFLAGLKPEQIGRMTHGTELYVRRDQ